MVHAMKIVWVICLVGEVDDGSTELQHVNRCLKHRPVARQRKCWDAQKGQARFLSGIEAMVEIFAENAKLEGRRCGDFYL